MRPRVVLLTGAPGSGKTALGQQLAATLRLPFIARDDVRGGLAFSEGAWSNELRRLPTGDEAVEVFLQTVEGLLAHGVSCVVEYVVRSHRPDDLDRLLATGECVVIMTTCADPIPRVVDRNLADRLIANPSILAAGGYTSVEEHTDAVVERMRLVEREMRVDFPVPVFHVDTTAGYDTDLEAIVAFATAPLVDISFRPLGLDDLTLLVEWFADPVIVRWWNPPSTLAEVAAKYQPRIEGREPTRMWIAQIDGRPAGLMQSYLHVDYPDHDAAVGIPRAVGIDYLLCEAARGRRIASAALHRFARHALAEHPEADCCVATPAQDNEPSWRALERAGFRRSHACTPPAEPPAFAYVMERSRSA